MAQPTYLKLLLRPSNFRLVANSARPSCLLKELKPVFFFAKKATTARNETLTVQGRYTTLAVRTAVAGGLVFVGLARAPAGAVPVATVRLGVTH